MCPGLVLPVLRLEDIVREDRGSLRTSRSMTMLHAQRGCGVNDSTAVSIVAMNIRATVISDMPAPFVRR